MKKIEKKFVFSVPQAIIVFEEGLTELTRQAILKKVSAIEEISVAARTSSDEITLHTKHGDQLGIWGIIAKKIEKIIDSQPTIPNPKAGDWIYINAGDKNFGGRARISSIKKSMSAGKLVEFACFEDASPNGSYNLPMLLMEQKSLRKNYGKRKAAPNKP